MRNVLKKRLAAGQFKFPEAITSYPVFVSFISSVYVSNFSNLSLYLICQFWGSSNSAAIKDMMSKIWTNGDTGALLSSVGSCLFSYQLCNKVQLDDVLKLCH